MWASCEIYFSFDSNWKQTTAWILALSWILLLLCKHEGRQTFWIHNWARYNRLNPQYIVCRAKIQWEWDRESHRNITWLGDFYLEWSFGYVKAIRKLGASFTHNWPQTQYNFRNLEKFIFSFIIVDQHGLTKKNRRPSSRNSVFLEAKLHLRRLVVWYTLAIIHID